MNADNTRICQNCKYFLQHYIWRRHGFTAINYGHCKHGPRVKHLHASKKACENWCAQDEDYIQFYLPPRIEPERR